MPNLVSFTSIYAVIRENSRTQLIFYLKSANFRVPLIFFMDQKSFVFAEKDYEIIQKTGD